MKFFLPYFFSLMACLSLHAEETAGGCIYYGNLVVVEKEYVVEKSASIKTDGARYEQNRHEKIASDNLPFIFISKNAKIYGRQYLYVKQKSSSVTLSAVKKRAKIKKADMTSVKHKIARQEAASILFAFPCAPSTSLFLQGGSESAAISPQQKLGKNQQVNSIYRKNIYPDISDLCLFYLLRQRQKLSTTATQCGMLTSFGSNFPPLSTFA